jgi:energy-coupling factor transport system ATP-binding protein
LDIQHSDIYAVNKKVGTVMQDTDAQFVALSSAEDIAFSLENQCMDQQDMQRLVTSMARIVDMEAFLSHSPQDLSGGQKQRVSLAGVLVDDVEVLLFDEPLANLDLRRGGPPSP